LTFVHVVAQEVVVVGVDITGVGWSLPYVKESHQIDVLAVDVSDDFDRRSDLFDDDWLSGQDLSALVGKLNDVFSLAWKLSIWFDILAFLSFQEWLQEHLAKSIIWILVNFGMIFLLWIKLLWFFSQFIN
jgi:hypothetical protein